MYDLRLDEHGELKANGTSIVQLRKPYNDPISKVFLKNKSFAEIYQSPAAIFDGSSKYLIKITDMQIQSLKVIVSHSIRCNVIYKLRQCGPSIFLGNVLNYIFVNLDSDSKLYERIQKYFRIVLGYITASKKFDYIITDIKHLSTILDIREYKVLELSGELQQSICGNDTKILNGLVKEYGSIPLRLLSSKFLRRVQYADTNLDYRTFPKGATVLVLTGFNLYHSGYVAKYLVDTNKDIEVLPVSFFYVL